MTPMCGRIARKLTLYEILEAAGVTIDGVPVALPDSYNVAPLQQTYIVRQHEGRRRVDLARWGLVPGWARDESMASRMINARAETIREKPAYREAFRSRRCVVPVSGFYEWQPIGSGKQAWYIHPKADVLLLAGVYERCERDGRVLETFSVITTAANAFMQRLHERMPVIIQRERVGDWLNAEADPAVLEEMLMPAPEGVLAAHPVSSRVNSPANDGAELLEEVEREGLF